MGMMMSAGCGTACLVVAVLGVLAVLAAVFFTLGGTGRRLRARLIVAQLRRRGVRASEGVFYGSPGEGWLAVTVNAEDPNSPPYVFRVRDREATVSRVLAEWFAIRATA